MKVAANRFSQRALLATLVMLALAAPAFAQSWPGRALTLVVPFAPGGPSDVAA
jgi:tripartite-type tricarboxylate transporter receptor subunit TctC